MATAIAHPNFALIKYWGKSVRRLNIPASGSISLTVDGLTTKTTVNFDAHLNKDAVWLNGKQLENPELTRLRSFLDLIREFAGESRRAAVNFAGTFFIKLKQARF